MNLNYTYQFNNLLEKEEAHARFLYEDKKLEGVKLDTEKQRMDLVPPEALFALSEVLTYGQAKYGDRNWELGMGWGRVFAATMRHLWKWWMGEANDPESGLPHTWHALANVAFLVTYEKRGIGMDTRSRSNEKNNKKEGYQEKDRCNSKHEGTETSKC